MKQIIAFFAALLGFNKKKPPVVVVPPVEKPPAEKVLWSDKRPIGMVMLASYAKWTGTDNYMNGSIPFDEWLINHANNCISNLKYLNAQGVVVWDPEGSKFPRALTYYGDPRLARGIVDPFFTAILKAGFRTGVCLRPDEIKMTMNPPDAAQWANMETPEHYVAASPLDNLIAKVEDARKRWGCTLFYVDSNVGWGMEVGSNNTIGSGQLLPSSIFADLHKLFPDCLFMPEHQDNSYYEFTAPYNDRDFRHLLSAEEKGFQVLMADGFSQEQLTESVKQGNILVGRVWYTSPEISLIKKAYEQA